MIYIHIIIDEFTLKHNPFQFKPLISQKKVSQKAFASNTYLRESKRTRAIKKINEMNDPEMNLTLSSFTFGL